MNEQPPIHNIEAEEETLKRQEKIKIVEEMTENGEVFPFPGINQESYDTIKAEQEEYPGYTTLIDELLEKFKAQGFKVVSSKYAGSGNVVLLPAESDDIYNDLLLLGNLSLGEDVDDRLKKLIDLT